MVFLRKTVLMQRLLDAVVRGHYWYTDGYIALERAGRLADKFADRYRVHATDNQRQHARRRGRANARWYLFGRAEESELRWWLVATAGTGLIHDREQLHDARDRSTRIRVADEYELLPLTKPRNQGGGTTWTWRMTRETQRTWRDRVLAAARARSSREMRVAMYSLSRTPGYSRIRRQVGSLVAVARTEWRRRHGSADAFPASSRCATSSAWRRQASDCPFCAGATGLNRLSCAVEATGPGNVVHVAQLAPGLPPLPRAVQLRVIGSFSPPSLGGTSALYSCERDRS